jgi:hypothetical protein
MAVWKNRVAADPTLEEDREENKSKRQRKVEKEHPAPAQYARCYACWQRVKVEEKVDPDEAIVLHRKSNCPKG